MTLQVKIGENLNYTVGRLRYLSDTTTNPTDSDTFDDGDHDKDDDVKGDKDGDKDDSCNRDQKNMNAKN